MRNVRIAMAMMVLVLALLAGAGYASDATSEQPAGLVIDATTLTEAPSFIDCSWEDTAMQVIARKDAEGQVRLAFNTCQSCGGSPYAWFEDLGDGNLQCQNCGLTFPLETVGTERAMGCNPVTISEFILDGDSVIVPEAVLKENAGRFKNWKKLD